MYRVAIVILVGQHRFKVHQHLMEIFMSIIQVEYFKERTLIIH